MMSSTRVSAPFEIFFQSVPDRPPVLHFCSDPMAVLYGRTSLRKHCRRRMPYWEKRWPIFLWGALHIGRYCLGALSGAIRRTVALSPRGAGSQMSQNLSEPLCLVHCHGNTGSCLCLQGSGRSLELEKGPNHGRFWKCWKRSRTSGIENGRTQRSRKRTTDRSPGESATRPVGDLFGNATLHCLLSK